jgi:hypothetical protein
MHTFRRKVVWGVLPGLLIAASAPSKAADVEPDPQGLARARTPSGRAEFLRTYCVDCHSSRVKSGGFVLEGVEPDRLHERPVVWEKVLKRMSAEEMPPQSAPRRPHATLAHAVRASIAADLDANARKNPFAGRTVIRRLNRIEYANAVRDLLRIDFFPYAGDLPQDGSAEGFDNIADSLSIRRCSSRAI